MREEVCGGKFSALAEREVLRDASARIALYPSRLKDEPRQGFLSVQIFERRKPLCGYRFSSGDEGLFYDTIFLKKPLFPFARKRRAMTGFYKNTIFLRGKLLLSCVLRRVVTGFKIPKTFAKRREATFEQKLPVSQSQIYFAIISVQF